MANTITRRPLPALVLLLALLVLTGIVWFRVLHRDTDKTDATPAKKTTPCTTPTAAPTRTLAGPSGITLVVLNSTNRNGIAAAARDTLVKDGFQVPRKAADDAASVTITSTAQIRYGSAGRDAATLLRYYFPGSTLVKLKSHTATVTVSLGEKYTAVASAATVKANLARDRLAVSADPSAPASTTTTGSSTTGGSPSPTATASC